MLLATILVVLPAIVTARISITVNVGQSVSDSSVQAIGSTVELIPDSERNSWRLNDQQLKDAAEKLSGGRPTDAFLKSPTPWNDLYVRYNWKQVERRLVPTSARIVNFRTEPSELVGWTFDNSQPKLPAEKTIILTRGVQHSTSNTWSSGFSLSVGQEISYGINYKGGTAGGSSTMSYTNSVGRSRTNTTTVTFGNSLEVTMSLPARTAVRGELYASRGTMEIEVNYRATLDGYAACNYRRKHNDHHFWAYHINSCLRAAGSPTEINARETITTGFFSQGRLVITDAETSKTLMEVPVHLVDDGTKSNV